MYLTFIIISRMLKAIFNAKKNFQPPKIIRSRYSTSAIKTPPAKSRGTSIILRRSRRFSASVTLCIAFS